ncbi:sugar-binding domain-containing protein [Bacteroides muris (ex Afrizal et al. 2022)]|uniref:Beta-glucuronidase n=2 Tax=Bacteroides TaxID=816 RepID=A0A4S2ALA6_9BACE|nr:sugar-binding domain-containing protein [Bacteroides muris (ex Afrizal et al. 2022)]TGY01643.1 beta-glucuronidase [Bacteroides muris (ex Afrizal et al. 2022)]
MRNKIIQTALAALAFMAPVTVDAQTQEIDLSGTWGFQTDFMDFRRGSLDVRYMHRLQESITLPGITDDYQIGYKSPYRHLDRLTRKFEYMGPAWYQREMIIPAEWKEKRIFMYFERTHWLSSIYVDTKEVSKIDYISVPHNHELTEFVKPGTKHLITVCIDNRYQYDMHKWNHAHTEFSQINWNGILGKMKLVAVDPVYVEDMQLYPDVARKAVKVKMIIKNHTQKPVSGKAVFTISGKQYELNKEFPVSGQNETISFEGEILLGKNIRLWDEFHPNLYMAECSLQTSDDENNYRHEKSVTFGMREVTQGKNHVLVNGSPIHLRGTVENAVFPQTGYAPVDDASWERIFTILKEHGMNHMRFHSWCPTKAAFRMADKLGIYLEVEMPMWGKDGENNSNPRFDFFRRELRGILREYGNHPSFILYCNGNEIGGDFDFVEELTRTGRESDSRRLFSGSTARKRVQSDQFYVTHQTPKGGATVYDGRPFTDWDIKKGTDIDVPVISHETGQRCAYPNFKEISLYKDCPVEARNFEIFQELLAENGMLDLADDFFKASGAQTVFEYKDVIEAQLRTSTSAGFQLLSINDLPEQGYSPVGVLDPFWNSKGLISPEDFRKFCAPTVALLRFKKRVYYNDETFAGSAEVYNFSEASLKNAAVKWQLADAEGKILKTGMLKGKSIGNNGVFPVGEFTCALPVGDEPRKLTVRLTVGKDIENSWDIWVYPRHQELMISTDEVLYTKVYDEKARQQLQAGKKVVLIPQPNKVKGRRSVFHNHFWNPVMFKWEPKTLGCLIHANHPAFGDFVTESHLDWQWWDILTYAKVIEMMDTPDELRPFIQTIDSFDRNHKLGIGFEARVNGGKLLVLAMDTQKDMEKRLASRQLLQSIDRYVKGGHFEPEVELSESFIKSFMME